MTPKNPTIESPTLMSPVSPPHKLPIYTDGDDEGKSPRPSLSAILFKHKNALNLKTVAAVVKENSRKPKPKEDPHNQSTQATEMGEDDVESRFNDKDWHRINAMVKDVTKFSLPLVTSCNRESLA